jgi:menaquinone-dependent protoporphyrinogen oxidase
MNQKILILYASRYGQTKKISQYIGERLSQNDNQVDLRSISDPLPKNLSEYQALLLGSSIYVGKPNKQLTRWAFQHRDAIASLPFKALFLVDLNAADPRPKALEMEKILMEQFQEATGCKPDLTANLIGALNYRSYGFFIRWILKQISKKAGGPVDTSRNYELTRWADVENFAKSISRFLSWPVSRPDKMSQNTMHSHV